MLVIFSYYTGDQKLALKNLKFIREMGDVGRHEILLLIPDNLDCGAELAYATACFKKAHVAQIRENNTQWPYFANWHFANACQIAEQGFNNAPFLWLEPDATPLRPSWLNEIESEYRSCRQPLMGGLHKDGDQHMNGVGVWLNVSSNAPTALQVPMPFTAIEAAQCKPIAFDFGSMSQHMTCFHESALFQIEYRKEFPKGDYSWIRPEAALLHTDKEGRVIDYLRAKYGMVNG